MNLHTEPAAPGRVRSPYQLDLIMRIGGAVLVTVIAVMIGVLRTSWEDARSHLDILQAAAIFVVFWLIVYFDNDRELDDSPANEPIREGMSQIKSIWGALWGVWLFLYSAFWLLEFPSVTEELPLWVQDALPNILNNLQSATLYLLFFVMFRRTLRRDHGRIPWGFVCATWGVVGAVELAFQHAFYRANELLSASALFGILSGVLAATAFGILIGRIESKFLKIPVPVIAFMYMYAAIQPLFPIFRLEDSLVAKGLFSPEEIARLAFVLKAIALAGKLTMYVAISYQVRTGRLAFYLYKVRGFEEDGDRQWKGFEAERFKK